MSYTNPTAEDRTFNAEYVELVTLGEQSVTDMIGNLARDCRRSATFFQNQGDSTSASAMIGMARTYEHALSMLDLAWDQAMARVARQVTA